LIADEAHFLGIDRAEEFHPGEPETPILLAVVTPSGKSADPGDQVAVQAIEAIASGHWLGKAKPLSDDHHEWEIIGEVSQACKRSRTEDAAQPSTVMTAHEDAGGAKTPMSAGRIIRQRRSAVSMDGKTGIPRDTFYAMLSRLVPALTPVPWDSLDWPISVHLGLFVHRVEGLTPGLYALVRDSNKMDLLKSRMDPKFIWKSPHGCLDGLPLFLLSAGDVQSTATSVSCGQEISGDGAFSLGMIAEFEPTIRQRGAHFYRRLFWETGVIGQVLYLEAEAAGIRSTGIGCFFDDPVHEVFGITNHDFQSLYHFTVGGHVDDPRLTTLSSYPSLSWKPRGL